MIKKPNLRAGFSLPEVTMAVGIASMAIVLLLGLVPTGLTSIRDAATTLAEARIYQQIVGEVQGSNWGQSSGGTSTDPLSYPLLARYNDARRFFDDQGTPLDESQSGSLRLAYVARVTLNQSGAGVAVPGGQTSGNMVAVTVDVASVPDAGFAFNDPGTFKTRSFIVARQY